MANFLDLPRELRRIIYFHMESLVPTALAAAGEIEEDTSPQPIDGGNYLQDGNIVAIYDPRAANNSDHDDEDVFDHSGWYLHFHKLFFRQPRVTRVCSMMRCETLSIFYGANTFLISNLYKPRFHEVQAPFPQVLWKWLRRIKKHITLLRKVEIWTVDTTTQPPSETEAALLDSEFNFKPSALSVVGI